MANAESNIDDFMRLDIFYFHLAQVTQLYITSHKARRYRNAPRLCIYKRGNMDFREFHAFCHFHSLFWGQDPSFMHPLIYEQENMYTNTAIHTTVTREKQLNEEIILYT